MSARGTLLKRTAVPVSMLFAGAFTAALLFGVARINYHGERRAEQPKATERPLPIHIPQQEEPLADPLPEPEPLLKQEPLQTLAKAAQPKAQHSAVSALPGLAGLEAGLSNLPPIGVGLASATGVGLSPQASAGEAPREARPIHRPAPRYPREARRRGVNGFVIVRMQVSAQGRVQSAKVMRADPPGVFDDVALEAARRYRFEPKREQGRAVPSTVDQRIVFRLRGGR